MGIFDRYLTRSVLMRLGLVLGVFCAVFAGYSLAIFLSKAAAGSLPPGFVLRLVALKTAIATEVLVPISVFVAVLFAIEGLRRSEQTTAFRALGFGWLRAHLALFPLMASLAVLVGILSIWGRPYFYREYYETRLHASAAFDLFGVEPGRFLVGPDGQRVMLVRKRGPDNRLEEVFIWSKEENHHLVVQAKALMPRDENENEGRFGVDTEGVRIWRIDDEQSEMIGDADAIEADFNFGDIPVLGYKRKAAPTLELMHSLDPEDRAEFQWRVTRPISTFVLGFLGLLVAGWSRPPHLATRTVVLGVVVCVLYNLVALSARNAVRDGSIGFVPGMWWVDATCALFLVTFGVWRLIAQSRRARGARA